MQVRTYRASNMQEALHLVRRELGSQAIIVSTKTIGSERGNKNGGRHQVVEVVAAIDYDPPLSPTALGAPPQSRDTKGSLWKELLSERVSLEHVRHELDEVKEMVKRSLSAAQQGNHAGSGAEVRELTWTIHSLLQHAAPLCYQNMSKPLVHVYTQMRAQGIAENIVVRIVNEVIQTLSKPALEDGTHVRTQITSTLEKELLLSGPLNFIPGEVKIVTLVGPTGVGKTTTLAKLAAHYALEEKKKVALVTIDTYRIAAVEQLKVYATIMGLPFKAVTSPQEFINALTECAQCDLILVDTAGRSQKDQFHLEELKEYFIHSFPFETHLVMSITHKDCTLSTICDQFGLLPVDKVIFTKLDECETYGSIVNQLLRIKKPLSYLTTGQKVPEDIEVATKERIISLVLNEADMHYC